MPNPNTSSNKNIKARPRHPYSGQKVFTPHRTCRTANENVSTNDYRRCFFHDTWHSPTTLTNSFAKDLEQHESLLNHSTPSQLTASPDTGRTTEASSSNRDRQSGCLAIFRLRPRMAHLAELYKPEKSPVDPHYNTTNPKHHNVHLGTSENSSSASKSNSPHDFRPVLVRDLEYMDSSVKSPDLEEQSLSQKHHEHTPCISEQPSREAPMQYI